MKRKISVTTGTRADYGFLKPVLKEISKSKKLELKLIVTGMHLSKKFGYTIREIQNDGFKISAKIPFLANDDTNFEMAKTLGKGIIEFSKIFHKINPEINLVFGDRDEMMASAIAAYHLNIPNAHIHGGDRTQGGIDEYNRHAITKMSNIHFAASKKSALRIIKMGENPKYVFFTGSTGIDQIKQNDITSKTDLENKFGIRFSGREILLLQHSVTTQTNLSNSQILQTLNALVKFKKLIIAIAPNSDPGHKKIFQQLKRFSKNYSFVKVYQSLPRRDYLGLLKNCGVLIGNSSSGIIEASYFKTPIINIGIRQKGREKDANIIEVPQNENQIFRAISKVFDSKIKKKHSFKKLYGVGNSSKKITSHLETIKLSGKLIQKQIFY